MKIYLFLVVFIVVSASYAETSKEFCQRLYDKANVEPKTGLKSQDPDKAMEEILDNVNSINVFADNMPIGIKGRMSWAEFKSFIKRTKKMELSNFFQAQYEGAYFNAYCGALIPQAQASSTEPHISTAGLFDNTNPTFKKQPSPQDHSGMNKEIGGDK